MDGYRLIDFFLTFPFELGVVRLRGSKLKTLAQSFETFRPYRWTSDPLYTFLQMIEFQTVAVGALVKKGVLNANAFDSDKFEISADYVVHSELSAQVDEFISTRFAALEALLEVIDEHGITGKDGLKARSGLMPYKYDVGANVVLD